MSTPKRKTPLHSSRSPNKPSVITLTPNPTLDLSGMVDQLIPNEKNSVRDERRDPGGNGINAARIIQRLYGKKVSLLATGFLGGAVGEEVRSLLRKEGLPSHWTSIEGNTRINVTVTLDSPTGELKQTRLSFPGPKVTAREVHTLVRELSGIPPKSILLLGGSLPQGLDSRFWKKLMTFSDSHQGTCIADLPAPELSALISLLKPNPTCPPLLAIKPNLHELRVLLNKKRDTALLPQIAKSALKLTSYAAAICVSMGSEGALLVSSKGTWKVRAPKIRARGTVGAGDSFLGAFAASLAHQQIHSSEILLDTLEKTPKPVLESLRLAVAAGAATAESIGTGLGRKGEILRLLQKVPVAERVT